MEKRVIRVYFSGYVEKEVPVEAPCGEIYDIKEAVVRCSDSGRHWKMYDRR